MHPPTRAPPPPARSQVTGFDADAYDPTAMVARIARIFKPGRMSVSLSVDVASRSGGYTWGSLACAPCGFGCESATCQELAAGGRVSFYTFTEVEEAGAPRAGIEAVGDAAAVNAKVVASAFRSDSPSTVLRHMLHVPSFMSLPTADSDYDLSCGSGDEHDSGSGGGSRGAPSSGKGAKSMSSDGSVERGAFCQ